MVHPWAKFRRAVNMTQAEVAGITNRERLNIIRLEAGMLGHLSDELIGQLADLYRQDPDLLVMEYRGYQRLQRLEFKSKYKNWRVILDGYQGRTHPLIYYREFYEFSRNQLCKALCLDYGPISDYEHNKQRSLPQIIEIAAEDMGWEALHLENAVLEWRRSGRSA